MLPVQHRGSYAYCIIESKGGMYYDYARMSGKTQNPYHY